MAMRSKFINPIRYVRTQIMTAYGMGTKHEQAQIRRMDVIRPIGAFKAARQLLGQNLVVSAHFLLMI